MKKARLDSTGNVARMSEATLEASYRIALRVAECKKAHTIGEELIKPCLVESVRLVCGEKEAEKINQIPLSNNTIKRRIDEMSEDILEQVIGEIKNSAYFALALDESTDVANCSQLLVYARYLKDGDLKEEFLFSHSLETTARGEDVFNVIADFVGTQYPWTELRKLGGSLY